MDNSIPVTKATEVATGSVRTYIVGFVASVGLTVLAYGAITGHWFTHRDRIAFIAALAAIQLYIQLICFLHVNRESRPRWNLMMLLFAVLVVGIVVLGSLWIMDNLNYNMMHMSPEETNIYLHEHEGI